MARPRGSPLCSYRAHKGDSGACALVTQHQVLRDAEEDILGSDPLVLVIWDDSDAKSQVAE